MINFGIMENWCGFGENDYGIPIQALHLYPLGN
jgi:hypothetical protein